MIDLYLRYKMEGAETVGSYSRRKVLAENGRSSRRGVDGIKRNVDIINNNNDGIILYRVVPLFLFTSSFSFTVFLTYLFFYLNLLNVI